MGRASILVGEKEQLSGKVDFPLLSLRRLQQNSSNHAPRASSSWFRRRCSNKDHHNNKKKDKEDFAKHCLSRVREIREEDITETSRATDVTLSPNPACKSSTNNGNDQISPWDERTTATSATDPSSSSNSIHHTWYYSSIHCLVNRERVKQDLKPLFRSGSLDELARQQAQRLAAAGRLEPTPRSQLVVQLQAGIVGENVLRGDSIREMHDSCMDNCLPRHRTRILSPKYNEMGAGTAKNEQEDTLYMVQYFRYNPDLAVETPNQSNSTVTTDTGGTLSPHQYWIGKLTMGSSSNISKKDGSGNSLIENKQPSSIVLLAPSHHDLEDGGSDPFALTESSEFGLSSS